MANNLLTDQHITSEALMILENNLAFTKNVTHEYDKEYKNAHRGATIYARKPPRYTVRDGQNVSLQDTTQTQVPITLNHQFGVDVSFSSSDLALNIDDFSENVLAPQIVQIANAIDFAGLSLALQVPNVVGTPGTTPGTGSTAQQALAVYSQAQALLDKNAAPRDGNRALVINEDAQAITVPNLAGLFNPTADVAKQYQDGTMGRALGLKWNMSQNVNVFTFGAQGGAPKVSVAIAPATQPFGLTLSSSVSTFAVQTSGWTASTNVLNPGDVVSFAGCYRVNPVSRQNAGSLKQFVVTNVVTSDGSGNATLQLGEPMIVAGGGPLPNPYQNVTAVPAVNAALTVVGASGTVSPQNLAFHKNAFTFACAPLPVPGGTHMAAMKDDDQLGIAMRFVAQYDIRTDLFIGRFDVLCGWAALRPEWAVRIPG